MAIIEQGILGGFRGSVGTVVGYWRLGRWCIRARSVAFKDARTAAQLTQRSRFKAMITLSSHLGPALQRGLTAAGNRHGMTEANLFMRLNNSCFEAEDGGVRVAYGRLRLSEGRLPGSNASTGASCGNCSASRAATRSATSGKRSASGWPTKRASTPCLA